MDSKMVIHPGEVLKEEFLEPYGLSANRLAQAIGVPPNRITAILHGTRGITGETAVLLGHALGTTSEFWINLQARYELDSARAQVKQASIRSADALARHLHARDGVDLEADSAAKKEVADTGKVRLGGVASSLAPTDLTKLRGGSVAGRVEGPWCSPARLQPWDCALTLSN